MTWEEIEEEIKKDEMIVQQILSYLMEGEITFKHHSLEQEGILHVCTDSESIYQFTYFDQFGPVGDFRRDTLEEMANGIREYRFHPCSKEEFQFIS